MCNIKDTSKECEQKETTNEISKEVAKLLDYLKDCKNTDAHILHSDLYNTYINWIYKLKD